MAKKPASKTKKKVPKKKGARKSTMTQKRKNANKSDAFAAHFKKLSVVILISLLSLWAIAWFILSDGPDKTMAWIGDKALSISAQAGFVVKKIPVEGREYTDADVLFALINVNEGDPILSFKPKEAKTQIEKIGWVNSAHVERRLPDTIYIRLIERKPIALWHNKGELFLVDEGGALITQGQLDRFKNLIMVRGKGAPKRTAELISMLKQSPELMKLIDHVELVDERRWDLILPKDKRIKLPEHDMKQAIAHIMNRHSRSKILLKDTIVEIDARYKDRLIVRTHLGKVQDYKAGADN